MSTLIHTDQVARADRVDFVEQLTSTTWVPMQCRSEHRDDFTGVFRASGFGAMQVVMIETMPITVTRTPRLISQADPDMLKMLLVCGGGASTVEQDDRQALLSPGEFAIYNTRRPYEVSCGVDGPTRVLTFMFPPSLLPLSPSGIKRLAGRRIPATSGLGHVTSQFLLQLARNIDLYTPAEAARLSAAALEVLATRLAHELDEHGWATPQAARHALLTTVQAFINQHLADRELSPASVAAAHHMSLRSLHQLFHDEGLTIAAWIRQRRLDGSRRELSDPACAHRSVAAIAARWGFASPADFSRAFRGAHGMPPAEYRRFALVMNKAAP
jgi:AraC-like DNA-binding protein